MTLRQLKDVLFIAEKGGEISSRESQWRPYAHDKLHRELGGVLQPLGRAGFRDLPSPLRRTSVAVRDATHNSHHDLASPCVLVDGVGRSLVR